MKRLLLLVLLSLVACQVVSQTVSVTFTWTATGNHGSSGTAAEYDFRYTDNPADSLFANINNTFWMQHCLSHHPNPTQNARKLAASPTAYRRQYGSPNQ